MRRVCRSGTSPSPLSRPVDETLIDGICFFSDLRFLRVALNCTEASALASLIPDLAPNERAVSPTPYLILYPNHNVRFLDDAAYW